MPGREWIKRLELAGSMPEGYAHAASSLADALAARIADLRERLARPVVIGIAGAQGSGKSTLALFLANWLEHETGLKSVRLALDDLYFGKQMRRVLARQVHPLLATRGVPGTHDVEVGRRAIAALTDTEAPGRVTLPVFDKASDDRVPGATGASVATPVDVVLFEGWCVGARPQPPEGLREPVNVLESNADLNGAWRRYVNERLRTDYARLFACIDALVMLRVPSFEKVYEWRMRQEHELRDRLRTEGVAAAASAGQTDAEILSFVMHYERLTRHMLATMPADADTIIDLDDEHRFAAVSNPGWQVAS